MTADQSYTVEEAAAFLGVSSQTVMRWAHDGQHGVTRELVGRKARYRISKGNREPDHPDLQRLIVMLDEERAGLMGRLLALLEHRPSVQSDSFTQQATLQRAELGVTVQTHRAPWDESGSAPSRSAPSPA